MGMGAKPAKKPTTKPAVKGPAKLAIKTAAKAPVKKLAKPPVKGAVKPEATKAPLKAEKGKVAKVAGKGADKGAEVEVVAVVPGKAAKGAKAAKPGKLGKDIKEKSAAAIERASQAGEKLCRESGCENFATTKGYCRLDYIKNWKKIKRKEMILKEGKLNQYIEELVSKYPDKYIDIIRQDLSTEVNFNKIIHDLELDESIDDLEYDGDSIDSLIGAISKSSDDMDDGDF